MSDMRDPRDPRDPYDDTTNPRGHNNVPAQSSGTRWGLMAAAAVAVVLLLVFVFGFGGDERTAGTDTPAVTTGQSTTPPATTGSAPTTTGQMPTKPQENTGAR